MKYFHIFFLILSLGLTACGADPAADVVSSYMASENDFLTLECECFWDEAIFDEPLYDSLESCLDDAAVYATAVETCLLDAPEDVREEIADVLACTDAVNRDALAMWQPLACDFDGVSEEEEEALEARWRECDLLPSAEYVRQCTGVSVSCDSEGKCIQCSAGQCTEL